MNAGSCMFLIGGLLGLIGAPWEMFFVGVLLSCSAIVGACLKWKPEVILILVMLCADAAVAWLLSFAALWLNVAVITVGAGLVVAYFASQDPDAAKCSETE